MKQLHTDHHKSFCSLIGVEAVPSATINSKLGAWTMSYVQCLQYDEQCGLLEEKENPCVTFSFPSSSIKTILGV